MHRRRLLAILLLLLVFTGGCVQLPQSITKAAPDPAPAWTIEQAKSRRAEIMKSVAAAAKTKNATAALRGLDGAERAGMFAQYDYEGKYGLGVPDDTWRRGTVVGLWSTSITSYPQTSLVLVKLEPKPKNYASSILEVYTRAEAASPWLRSGTVPVEKTVAWPTSGQLVSRVPARVNGLSTRRVPELIAALNRPNSSSTKARFEQNDVFTSSGRQLRTERKEDGTASASATYASYADAWALPVKGGTVMVAPLTYTFSTQMKDDWIFSYGKPFNRYFKGKGYTREDRAHLVVYLVYAPAKGKISLIGEDWTETGRSAS